MKAVQCKSPGVKLLHGLAQLINFLFESRDMRPDTAASPPRNHSLTFVYIAQEVR
jgi:hypothetical protein